MDGIQIHSCSQLSPLLRARLRTSPCIASAGCWFQPIPNMSSELAKSSLQFWAERKTTHTVTGLYQIMDMMTQILACARLAGCHDSTKQPSDCTYSDDVGGRLLHPCPLRAEYSGSSPASRKHRYGLLASYDCNP